MVAKAVRTLLSRWAAVSTGAAVLVGLAAVVALGTGESPYLVVVLISLVILLLGVATIDRRAVALNRRVLAAGRSAGRLEPPVEQAGGVESAQGTTQPPGERLAATEGIEALCEMTALVNLFQVLGPPGMLPQPTNFSATPRTIHAMVAEVLGTTTDLQVVECGSGMSTRLAGGCLSPRRPRVGLGAGAR